MSQTQAALSGFELGDCLRTFEYGNPDLTGTPISKEFLLQLEGGAFHHWVKQYRVAEIRCESAIRCHGPLPGDRIFASLRAECRDQKTILPFHRRFEYSLFRHPFAVNPLAFLVFPGEGGSRSAVFQAINRRGTYLIAVTMVSTRIGHLGIEVSDLPASRKFYDALLGVLGFRLVSESGVHAGYSDGTTQVWISRSEPRRVTRLPPSGEEEVVSEHVAFLVNGREMVDQVNSGMEMRGFRPLFPPEEHPEFVDGYYAASFEDPDHYVIEVYAIDHKGRA